MLKKNKMSIKNNMFKNIRKYSTSLDKILKKEELNFNFSAFYIKHKAYLPNNLSPTYNFLS
jgi:hypothetical protein